LIGQTNKKPEGCVYKTSVALLVAGKGAGMLNLKRGGWIFAGTPPEKTEKSENKFGEH